MAKALRDNPFDFTSPDRDGMNQSHSSEPKRKRLQADHTPHSDGPKTPLPPDPLVSKPSTKRKALEGQAAAWKNKPLRAASAPRQDSASPMVKEPGRSLIDKPVRHRNDIRSKVNQKPMKNSKTKAKHFT